MLRTQTFTCPPREGEPAGTTERQTQNGTEYTEQNDELQQVQTKFISKSTVLFILQD